VPKGAAPGNPAAPREVLAAVVSAKFPLLELKNGLVLDRLTSPTLVTQL
jgi:hypothetical protein